MRKEWNKPEVMNLGIESTEVNHTGHKEHYGIVGNDHICPKCGETPFPFISENVGFSCQNTNTHVTDCKGTAQVPSIPLLPEGEGQIPSFGS